jgi:hypothetical protein
MRNPFKSVSALILAVLLLMLLLQWIPVTGIFLMIIAGPLIAGLLVHVFLISVLVESWLSRLPRVCALLPIAAYGGYYALHAEQARQVAALSAALVATNPTRVFAFDPQAHALVSSQAQDLVRNFAIPVAYQGSPHIKPEAHLAFRLIRRDQCDIPKDSQSRVQTFGVHVDGKFQKQLCMLQLPERPLQSRVIVEHGKEQAVGRPFWQIKEATVRVVVDGSVQGAFRTANVQKLPRFPWIGIGCALNSGAARWDCFADFWRHRETIDATPAAGDRTLAKSPEALMLGLRKYTAAELADYRGYPAHAAALTRAAQEPQRVSDAMFAALESLLEGWNTELPHNLGYALAREPARLAPFAERMAQRFIVLQAEKPPRRDEVLSVLATALAALPAEDFARVAGSMFAAVRAGSAERHPLLFLRAADYGPQAQPFYTEQFTSSRSHTRMLATLALCRIGAADAVTIAEMKARITAPEIEKDARHFTALVVALARFGETEFLRGVSMPKHRLQDWLDKVLAGESNSSAGPNNCMSHEGLSGHLGAAMQPVLVRGRGGWVRREGVS